MIAEWHVFFAGAKHRRWWDVFLTPGFRHCGCFGYDPEAECWVIFNPLMRVTVLRPASGLEIDEVVSGIHADAGCVVRYRPTDEATASAIWVGCCTAAVARLLGLPGRALRPESLWRDLVRRGAVPAFEVPDGERVQPERAEARSRRGSDAPARGSPRPA